MKMRLAVLFSLLAIGFVIPVQAQQSFSASNHFGFRMDEPRGWYQINKDEIAANLQKLDISNGKLEEFLSQNQGKHLLFAYVKYKQDTFTGVNPKIEGRVLQIYSRKPLTFLEFRPLAITTLRKIAGQSYEQRYVVEPSDIKIGGVDSIYHISEFTLKLIDGREYRVRSQTYLIPRGTYFLQISFADEPGRNDCSVLFDQLLKSIRFIK